jgi:hypothetical protein
MNNQLASSHDEQVAAQSTIKAAVTGLFSHPDVHHASTRPGERRHGAYTDLFREPAGGSPGSN